MFSTFFKKIDVNRLLKKHGAADAEFLFEKTISTF